MSLRSVLVVLALTCLGVVPALAQTAPSWNSYAVTHNANDIVPSTLVAAQLGLKVDVNNGKMTGSLTINGTTATAATLQVASPNAGTLVGPSTWTPAFAVFGPNASTSQGAALGISYDTTDGAAILISVSPAIAWEPMDFEAASNNFYIAGSGTASLSVVPSGIYVGGYAKVAVSTVATLPTCNSGSKGGVEYVSDATSPTFNATLAGGGTVNVLAGCNGTNWTAQ